MPLSSRMHALGRFHAFLSLGWQNCQMPVLKDEAIYRCLHNTVKQGNKKWKYPLAIHCVLIASVWASRCTPLPSHSPRPRDVVLDASTRTPCSLVSGWAQLIEPLAETGRWEWVFTPSSLSGVRYRLAVFGGRSLEFLKAIPQPYHFSVFSFLHLSLHCLLRPRRGNSPQCIVPKFVLGWDLDQIYRTETTKYWQFHMQCKKSLHH